MLVIILFILILNIISILLMYRCLVNSERKEKLIFIAAGTALMYILTSVVYWISTRNIEITEVSQYGKDLIIFAFVPVNGILILPFFAKSFSKFKSGKIDGKILRNRGIVLAVFLIALLIIECVYFKTIQEQVVDFINEQRNSQVQSQEENQDESQEESQEEKQDETNANQTTNTMYLNPEETGENIINADTVNELANTIQ